MSETATIEHEVGDPPTNRDGHRYAATAGGWSCSGDLIYNVIDQAWILSRNVESTVTIWDFSGDGIHFDPNAAPRAIYAVGTAYIGE